MAVTSTASATTDTQLAAPDSARGGIVITNTDANRLYVLLDSGTSSSTNYSFYLDTGDVFDTTGYAGEVRGVWTGDGTGAALVTTWGR